MLSSHPAVQAEPTWICRLVPDDNLVEKSLASAVRTYTDGRFGPISHLVPADAEDAGRVFLGRVIHVVPYAVTELASGTSVKKQRKLLAVRTSDNVLGVTIQL